MIVVAAAAVVVVVIGSRRHLGAVVVVVVEESTLRGFWVRSVAAVHKFGRFHVLKEKDKDKLSEVS